MRQLKFNCVDFRKADPLERAAVHVEQVPNHEQFGFAAESPGGIGFANARRELQAVRMLLFRRQSLNCEDMCRFVPIQENALTPPVREEIRSRPIQDRSPMPFDGNRGYGRTCLSASLDDMALDGRVVVRLHTKGYTKVVLTCQEV